MVIHIKGGTRKQKQYIRNISLFCINKLMPRMKNLEINITLKDFGKDDSCGYCLATDDADPYRPREFDIEINKNLKLRRLLETIAHELVHVKQFARSELYESTVQGKHRWQGKWINKDLDYYDQPWEIEAHGREAGLFIRWAEKEGHANKKWTQNP